MILDWLKAGLAAAFTALALGGTPAMAGESHAPLKLLTLKPSADVQLHPQRTVSPSEKAAELHESILQISDRFFSTDGAIFGDKIHREPERLSGLIPAQCGPAKESFESFKSNYLKRDLTGANAEKQAAHEELVRQVRELAQRVELLLFQSQCVSDNELRADSARVRVALTSENPAQNLLQKPKAASFWEISTRQDEPSISPLQLKDALGTLIGLEHFASECVVKHGAIYSRAPKFAWEKDQRARFQDQINEAYLKMRLATCHAARWAKFSSSVRSPLP